MPPCAGLFFFFFFHSLKLHQIGWGMGIDRMVMLLTGTNHIRESILFPPVGKKYNN